jgi:phosphate transport system substrate-binding protein
MNPKNTLRVITAGLLAGAIALGAGCSRPAEQNAASNSIVLKGSDTMVHLGSEWAEAFMAAHPEASISVTGGGSGTGIAALINGTTDICMSSRDIKEEEVELAKKQGIEAKEHAVALDGLAIVVHPSNPIADITMDQIKSIYTGEYANWQDLGQPAEPMVLLSRESNSGTFVFFREHVLDEADFSTDARFLPATSTIIQQVAEDKGAIGYAGLGYAEKAGATVKVVPVRESAEAAPVTPTSATVIDGSYSIARPLFFYIREGAPDLAQRFLEFCLSPEGQAIAEEVGYVRVN